jgi:hypothetical protein
MCSRRARSTDKLEAQIKRRPGMKKVSTAVPFNDLLDSLFHLVLL